MKLERGLVWGYDPFQLPLSGSQNLEIELMRRFIEQTFNSLSRDHMNPQWTLIDAAYNFAFNSLSRDHDDVEKAIKAAAQKFFQLPLSGSLLDITTVVFRSGE